MLMFVECDYDVVNGFSGMQRDIVLRLCAIVWENVGKIKAIIAMSQTHFMWKNHSFFVNGRPNNLLVNFVDNDAFPKNIVTIEKNRCYWSELGWYQCILNKEIKKGIYKTIVEFQGDDFRACHAGIISKSHLDQSGPLHWNVGTCCIGPNFSYFGSSYCVSESLFPAQEQALVGVEVNMDIHTVYFFANSKQIAHCVRKVPSSVYFMFDNKKRDVLLTVVSFQKLVVSSVDRTVNCKEHYFGKKD